MARRRIRYTCAGMNDFEEPPFFWRTGMQFDVSIFSSPIGDVVMAHREETLHGLGFADHWQRLREDLLRRNPAAAFRDQPCPKPFQTALDAYFRGDLGALDGLSIHLVGTPFQRDVWAHLQRIPVGETISYSELAQRVGRPRAVRAVGAANGSNPISLVVPCHRVIRSDGSLCGYGGGVERKRWLLAHEAA